MKFIIKNKIEPIEFTDWKNNNPNLKYNDLKNPEKAILKDSLICEQKKLCCYCECRLINDDSNIEREGSNIEREDSHIEHFRPKDNSMFPELQFEYTNLFASCTKNKGQCSSDKEHCGHKKSNYFSDKLISPLEKDCDKHFIYSLEGEILPKDENDDRAIETIEILNLNSELLIEKRKEIIDFLYEHILTLEEEISKHLAEKNNTLGEFYSMVDSLFNKKLHS
ncbi:MAG: TIGR02646 family protein [Bacteroidetes bacterium]|nr:TIGR02646 family protein [Bacteroidota bacterium]